MKWSLFPPPIHTQQGDLTHQILDNQESTLLTEEARGTHVKENFGKCELRKKGKGNFKGGTRLIYGKDGGEKEGNETRNEKRKSKGRKNLRKERHSSEDREEHKNRERKGRMKRRTQEQGKESI